jgi:hypothetical protein
LPEDVHTEIWFMVAQRHGVVSNVVHEVDQRLAVRRCRHKRVAERITGVEQEHIL